MKKCLHCGEICNDDESICHKCGALVNEYITTEDYMDVYHGEKKKIFNKSLILWFLLGLVLPYIGFLVSWVLFDEEREKAKALLIGTIISTVIASALPFFLSFISSDNRTSENNLKGEDVKCLLEIYNNL